MRWESDKNLRLKPERTAERGEYGSDRKLMIEGAVKKTEKILKNAIKETDFVGEVYSKEEVDNDLNYVQKEEESFNEGIMDSEDKRTLEFSRIFEAIIYDQGELANWFGENGATIKSSRFDDIKNGVDLIVEFSGDEEETSHLALAVDVTFSDNIQKKLDNIKREIEHGKLTNIKYFQSDKLGFKGEKRDIPKTVVGADVKTLNKVMDLWVNEDEKRLAEHPIQFIILDEIMAQLEKFREYAQAMKKSNIVEKYDKAIAIMEKILAEKQDLREEVLKDDDSAIRNDRVYQAITGYIDKVSAQKGPKTYKY